MTFYKTNLELLETTPFITGLFSLHRPATGHVFYEFPCMRYLSGGIKHVLYKESRNDYIRLKTAFIVQT